jgi:outer membrane protein TolC
MKRIILSTILILASGYFLFSQENNPVPLSLRQCVQMAVDENINIRTARIDAEKSQHKKAEAISALIPKINLGANFQDNLSLPTTMIPGEIFGQPDTRVPVQMGAKFNTGAAATVSWVLYNQTAVTAVQLAKKITELSDLGIEKAAEELAVEVAKLYFLTVATAQQKSLIEENINRTKRIKEITKVLVDNGMVRQVDYDRVSISLENLYTQLSNVEAGLEQQHNMMKYILNIPLDKTIVLTDTDISEIQLLQNLSENLSDFSNHIDIRLLESQQEINRTNQRMVRSANMPTVMFTGQYAIQGMQNEFRNYFNSSNRWFSSSFIGLGVSIPIFDGGERRSQVRQANLEIQRTEALLFDKKEKFTVDFQNAVNNYRNNRANVERQRQNIVLAERVYDETAQKYREGLASMSDLLQDEMSLSSAQANYLTALYNYRESEIKIMSLNGKIRDLIMSEPRF